MTMRDLIAGLSNKKSGFSIVTVIILMFMLAVAGRVVVSLVSTGAHVSTGHMQSTQAFYAAEAGLEWVNKAVTFVSGSDSLKAGRRVFFDITNNTGADITITGLTASWSWPDTSPADNTQFYEQVRIDGGLFSKDVIWNYTNHSSDRAGDGEAVDFDTSVTLVNGTQYEFSLYEFKNDETGSTSNGDMEDAVVRVAFEFTPNSFDVGQGTFTISVPEVTSGNNAVYASTATAGDAERKVQTATIVRFGPLAAGAVLTLAGSPTPNTTGAGGEDLNFSIENETGANIDITSLTVGFTGAAAWYNEVDTGGTTVFSDDSNRKGNGDTTTFSETITVLDGSKVAVKINNWRDSGSPGSGNRVNVSGRSIEVEFSDGSVVSFTP